MRVLFITGGGSGPVYALSPLASAARTAGHEVLVASPRENVQEISELGLPAVAVTDLGVFEAMFWDRNGQRLGPPKGEEAELEFASRGFGRITAASYDTLVDLVEQWRPDLVVGGTRNYAAGLLGHQFSIPYVCQAWDAIERVPSDAAYASDELRPELDRLGLDQLPTEDLYVHITPPSIRPPDAEPAQMMRWVPGNRQVPVERWMYTKPDRPRVCITSGSRSTMIPALGAGFFRPLLANPVFQGTEVVVATSDQVAAELIAEFPDLRAGFLPLDVVAGTCDLMVHHGGGVTSMTAMNAGVPQLAIADMLASAVPIRRVEEFGAGMTLLPQDPAEEVSSAVKEVLSNPSYRMRAQELAREIAALPSAAAVVETMVGLVGTVRR